MPSTHPSIPTQSRSRLSLYDSLRRATVPFEPRISGTARVYNCGPTVYNHVHIGNWLATLCSDVLVRWLELTGHEVTYVQNITDIDDKVITGCQAAGEDRASFTSRWTAVFFEGMRRLGCRMPDHSPRATDHIDGMVEMIQKLLDKGNAYLAEDGSVYYRVASFEDYGKLAGLDLATLREGASGRVSNDEYDKDSVADFALWKGHADADGDIFWEPSFTVDGAAHLVKGRPGWHIECSVMSTALLGKQIDIHTGGIDLRFPHHQNEIAQSEAALDVKPFVRVWMHNRHLQVEGAKMSKSDGTFITLKQLIDEFGETIVGPFRYLVVASHYRSSLDFTFAGLRAAGKTLGNLRDARARLLDHAGEAPPSDFAATYCLEFVDAMNDDINTPRAIGAIHRAVGVALSGLEAETLSSDDAKSVVDLLALAAAALGLQLEQPSLELTDEERKLVDQRIAAREAKNWTESDRLRDVLADRGLIVKDTPAGQEVRRLS